MNKPLSEERSIGRLVNFSDAVYAIAITLLILTVQIPENIQFNTNNDVMQVLLDLRPHFFSYVFSFYIIGMYWEVHHRMFRSIVKINDKLISLNLISLFFISFIPIPTALLSRAGDIPLGAAFYGLWMFFCSLSFRFLWNYSYRHKLMAKSVTKDEVLRSNIRGIIPVIIFAVSVPLAYLSPYLAEAIWLLQLFVRPKIVTEILAKSSNNNHR